MAGRSGRWPAPLHRAAPGLAWAWWILVVIRGALPAVLAVAIGVVVGAVNDGAPLGWPLAAASIALAAMQILPPLHQAVGANLGSCTANWLNGELTDACINPPGVGHLEEPELVDDLVTARDFDLGIMGPPLYISMDFIASGLVDLLGGLAAAIVLVRFAWWAPILLCVAWGCTHWLLRESGVWRDRQTPPVQLAQRHADYAYRLAVDAPASKEVRVFVLGDWVVGRFGDWARRLSDLKWEATRLRERSLVWCLLIVVAANALVFWAIGDAAFDGRVGVGAAVTFAQTTFATSLLAFGGLNWALDGGAAPCAAVARIGPKMAERGALSRTGSAAVASMPQREIRFRDVTFWYPTAHARTDDAAQPGPTSSKPVLDGFDLTIPAGTSLAVVGQNGAGKTTLAKLLCRLYDPQGGAIEVDGIDLRDLDVDEWRQRVTAVFQDFVRYELPLRDNVTVPHDGSRSHDADESIHHALKIAGAEALATLDTPLARGYPGGSDLSGGQWQRIALARAVCAVDAGAGVVLLDEPTAQLDVRGEAEIFSRLLDATRGCTTILVSHRFSTVRRADRIAVVEHGRVVELGTHDELMALNGRYRTMYDLQAARFIERDETGLEVVHERL